MKKLDLNQLVLIKNLGEHPAVAEMRYEIREIVTVATQPEEAKLGYNLGKYRRSSSKRSSEFQRLD